MTKLELLAPAGDLERAKTAYDYGADAVYVGGKRFSLRSRASNFDLDDIAEAVRYAHLKGRKLYVTVNMLPHEEDLEGLEAYLSQLAGLKVDAIIVASIAIVRLSKKIAPEMEVHLSTQLSITNPATIRFYQGFGADRIVLARELDLDAITELVQASPLAIEVFIHGGMCANYSGRCTLSNELSLRDANRGGCAQSCRWLYELKAGDQIVSDPATPFTMGSKDLSTLGRIEALIESGALSFKIEGRMKSAYYIAVIVKVYRTWIDALLKGEASPELMTRLQGELTRAESRATFDGFLAGTPKEGQIYHQKPDWVNQTFIGPILTSDPEKGILVEMRNPVRLGEVLEVLEPHGEPRTFTVTTLTSEDDSPLEMANVPMAKVWMRLPFIPESRAFLRRKGQTL